jgi:biopolymer transport protein ExbD
MKAFGEETSEHIGTETAERTRPSINVTPLIDILLVLLIIFMVVTPLRPARFKAMIPEPPPDNVKIRKSQLTLIVEVDERLGLSLILGKDLVAEGTIAEAGAISARLAAEWRERKLNGEWKPEMEARVSVAPDERIERTVFIRAPRSVPYGEVAKVIDAVKGAGAEPIGLQTDELPN